VERTVTLVTAEVDLGDDATPNTGARLQELIRRMILDRVHVEIHDPTMDLFETGIIDSLGLVELLLGIESEFGIRIATEDLDVDNFRSLTRITDYVGEHTSSGGSSAP
jgi:methoxymalonate biosynthesis acyl carrier protein